MITAMKFSFPSHSSRTILFREWLWDKRSDAFFSSFCSFSHNLLSQMARRWRERCIVFPFCSFLQFSQNLQGACLHSAHFYTFVPKSAGCLSACRFFVLSFVTQAPHVSFSMAHSPCVSHSLSSVCLPALYVNLLQIAFCTIRSKLLWWSKLFIAGFRFGLVRRKVLFPQSVARVFDQVLYLCCLWRENVFVSEFVFPAFGSSCDGSVMSLCCFADLDVVCSDDDLVRSQEITFSTIGSKLLSERARRKISRWVDFVWISHGTPKGVADKHGLNNSLQLVDFI